MSQSHKHFNLGNVFLDLFLVVVKLVNHIVGSG